MSTNKKELIQKVEVLVDQLASLVDEYGLKDTPEYNQYYNIMCSTTIATGQSPIEKIAHASCLVGILSLKLQGAEKVDQMLNSGMKMVMGDGKIEISYAEKPGVTNIAMKSVIDFNTLVKEGNEVDVSFSGVGYNNEEECII